MLPSFLSITSLYGGFLRRSFIGAGLSPQTIHVDDETTVHFWSPKNQTTQKPVLVLIHGFGPMAVWQWRQQVKFFSPHFHVYVPDLIFFGESKTTSTERSDIFQAAALAKLLDKLQVERFHVMGTSYGGFIAYHLARMLGEERVQKVVIASSGVNMRKSDNEALLKRAEVDKIEDLMLPSTPRQLRNLMALSVSRRLHMVPDFFLNDFVNKLYSENRKEKLELLKGVTLGKDDASSILPLQQEVLILWGEHDQIFPVNMATELQRVIGKKARLELIKEASHVPQIEKPAEFNNIVLKFLRGTSS